MYSQHLALRFPRGMMHETRSDHRITMVPHRVHLHNLIQYHHPQFITLYPYLQANPRPSNQRPCLPHPEQRKLANKTPQVRGVGPRRRLFCYRLTDIAEERVLSSHCEPIIAEPVGRYERSSKKITRLFTHGSRPVCTEVRSPLPL